MAFIIVFQVNIIILLDLSNVIYKQSRDHSADCEISRITKKHGMPCTPTLLNRSGKIPTDVDQLGVDLLSVADTVNKLKAL